MIYLRKGVAKKYEFETILIRQSWLKSVISRSVCQGRQFGVMKWLLTMKLDSGESETFNIFLKFGS